MCVCDIAGTFVVCGFRSLSDWALVVHTCGGDVNWHLLDKIGSVIGEPVMEIFRDKFSPFMATSYRVIFVVWFTNENCDVVVKCVDVFIS